MKSGMALRALLLISGIACAVPAFTQDAAPKLPAGAQDNANAIAKEVEQIRGLTFKQPVRVESQSIADFKEYVSREIDTSVPKSIRAHYGDIVRTLGLYRGPRIEDFTALMTTVMSSQVGAYYDPEKQSFFVLAGNMPELMQGVMYSHELYHALQDQYFDLTRYMDMGHKAGAKPVNDPVFNSDSRMARTAVVEGEATYIMSMWVIQKMSHQPATREQMSMVVAMQSNLSMDQMREALKQQQVSELLGEDMKDTMKAADEIPAFIMDSMLGVYFKGMSFVFAVQEQGWPAVEKLYTEYPPQSTEHILHPEKWLAREAPVGFEWPKFGRTAALHNWELLDDDVLGEFQWRIIFREQGLAKEADSVAAGWGGDRYAVFKKKDSDATLLLLRTCWDSEQEAKEFADAYRRVLATKYADAPVPTLLEQQGVDVYVVEGGAEKDIQALMKLVSGVKPVKPKRG